MTFLLAFALGITAGLRSMTPPAAVAWAAHFGWLSLDGTPLAFLGSPLARWILLAAMISELVADKLASSRGSLQMEPHKNGVRLIVPGKLSALPAAVFDIDERSSGSSIKLHESMSNVPVRPGDVQDAANACISG